MRIKIAVTGSDGFIGKNICKDIISQKLLLKRLYRFKGRPVLDTDINYKLSEMIPANIFNDVSCLIHCAAKVHSPKNKTSSTFIDLNTESTISLLKAAAESGIERFIFISTVAVYGLDSSDIPITDNHETNPKTEYGKSKLSAENEIKNICQKYKISYTIIRLPLVYGPNAPGNFGLLQKLIKTKVPLPFNKISNIRTMCYVKNVANFTTHIIKGNYCLNKVVLFCDGSNFSLQEIVNISRKSMGRYCNNFYFPKIVIKLLLNIFSKNKIYSQLYENLEFIESKSVAECGWRPKYRSEVALKASFEDRN